MSDYYTQIDAHPDRVEAAENDDTAHDGGIEYSAARTWFKSSDSDRDILMSNGRRHSWREMKHINAGKYESEQAARIRVNDTERDIDIFATCMSLSSIEKQRSIDIIDSRGGVGAISDCDRRIVILAVMTLVVNENGRHVQREAIYGDLIETIGCSRTAIHTTREKIRPYL